MRPTFAGAPADRVRARRLATLSTVWVCWCAVFVATAALLRVLEDPPPPGFDPDRAGWGVVHGIVSVSLAAGWLLVVAAGAPLGLRALRSRPGVRRVVLPPVVLLGVCALMFVPLQVYASRHWAAAGRPATASDIPSWWALLAVVFLLALGIDIVWGTIALAIGLRRAELDVARLRRPAEVAAALVVPMAVVVVLVVAVALVGAPPAAAGPWQLLVYVTVAGLLAVLTVACVSARRALMVVPGY